MVVVTDAKQNIKIADIKYFRLASKKRKGSIANFEEILISSATDVLAAPKLEAYDTTVKKMTRIT